LEKTLVILKPDAVDRRLVGEIIARFERKGLLLLGLKMTTLSRSLAEKHYEAHRGKPFYEGLLTFMTGGPVVLLVLGGEHAIDVTRKLMGETAGWRSAPNTVRGDYALSSKFNLIHGSDSPEAAERELQLFFRPGELVEPRPSDAKWFADE
jgi:nucleoside-diphosphate kinase